MHKNIYKLYLLNALVGLFFGIPSKSYSCKISALGRWASVLTRSYI